jgi:hypothetical protein
LFLDFLKLLLAGLESLLVFELGRFFLDLLRDGLPRQVLLMRLSPC